MGERLHVWIDWIVRATGTYLYDWIVNEQQARTCTIGWLAGGRRICMGGR